MDRYRNRLLFKDRIFFSSCQMLRAAETANPIAKTGKTAEIL
jgi:hypothetical protein